MIPGIIKVSASADKSYLHLVYSRSVTKASCGETEYPSFKPDKTGIAEPSPMKKTVEGPIYAPVGVKRIN